MTRKYFHLLMIYACVLCIVYPLGESRAETDLTSFFLPTPDMVDESETPEIIELATPTPVPALIRRLPDLSLYLGVKKKLSPEYHLEYQGYMADAYIYATTDTGKLSNYLEDCLSVGYSWSFGQYFSNLDAYRIQGGGHTAYLIPQFGSNIMLLLEEGMEMEEEGDSDPFREKQLMITINDATYILEQTTPHLQEKEYYQEAAKGYEYSGTWGSDLGSGGMRKEGIIGQEIAYSSLSSAMYIEFGLPLAMKNYNTYTMTKGDNPDGLSLIIQNLAVIPEVHVATYTHAESEHTGLEGEADYFSIQIVNCDIESVKGKYAFSFLRSCQCKFEGKLWNGAVSISGTFNYVQ